MAMKKIFMKFENKEVPGLKAKLMYERWKYFKVENGLTIMYKWITDSNGGVTVTNQKRKFDEICRKYLDKKDQEKFEQEAWNKQNRLDKQKFLNRGVTIDKTPVREILAENKRRAAAMGLTFAKYDRKKTL